MAMRYVADFRQEHLARAIAREISDSIAQPTRVMEVCGGHTHAIFKYGLQELLRPELTTLHGPGCPVCVTPMGKIDQAIKVAQQRDVILVSYGDMLRVPGTNLSLLEARSRGADVRVIYSPMDGLRVARQNPNKEVVFFAIGFETSTPPTAVAIKQQRGR